MLEQVEFVLAGLPPTDNASRRLPWMTNADQRRSWRSGARYSALSQMVSDGDYPWERAELMLVFTFTQNRRQGLDAYVGACKPIIDGLVDAGRTSDDGFRTITSLSAIAHIGPRPQVEVRLWRKP